jgi:DNA mismatch repair protein MutL
VSIIVLPQEWVGRIAAGEVVERPASVVKELLENALDAGAKEISVWVEGSGSSAIRVSDDGEGIAAEELPVALERHSTSKLKDEADLFRIATLGFRGEALPSIASVSRFEIVSRARHGQSGARLRVEGGKKGPVAAAACAAGTTVEVRELFFNTPARRKFLKSPATELGHICDVVNRMALAYAEVHFRLYHGTRMLGDYVGAGRMEDRLQQVLGPELAAGLTPFRASKGRTTIRGFLSAAPASFPNSRYLYTYVNRRFVRDRILSHAILQGYETLLMKGRFPAVVLFLELPYEEVDVNVHPAKYEVRFRRQSEIHEAVAEAVRSGLRQKAKVVGAPELGDEAQPAFAVREAALPYPTGSQRDFRTPLLKQSAAPAVAAKEVPGGFFSSLEILGQILGCYLVCGSVRGLALVDQHAAHERIAYERMRRQLERGEVERQNLLIPQVLELPVGEAAVLEQGIAVLDDLGFDVEKFGPNSFAIRAVPALLAEGDYREILRRMVAELAEVGRSREVREELEERLMTIACHSVIRANRKLDREEIRALLSGLDEIDFATQCPHGRPVLLEFTREQLEKIFKRA